MKALPDTYRQANEDVFMSLVMTLKQVQVRGRIAPLAWIIR